VKSKDNVNKRFQVMKLYLVVEPLFSSLEANARNSVF
jgi:hypothetical protein